MRSRLWIFGLVIGLLVFPSHVQAGHVWSRTVGGPTNCSVDAIALEPSGNIITTGGFRGTTNFGGDTFSSVGSYDAYLAKFDPNGSHIWSRAFGSPGYDGGSGLSVDDAGNVLVTGSFQDSISLGGSVLTSAGSSDIFLGKFDSNGNHVWSAAYGDADYDRGHSVTADGSGNAIVTGRFAGTVDFGGGPLVGSGTTGDIFIVKYDPAGGHLWSKRFGLGSSDWGQVVAVDSANNVIVTGFFYSSIDFGGGLRSSVGYGDVFLVKYAPDGAHLWSRSFGGPFSDYVAGMCVGPSQGIVLTGSFSNSINLGGTSLTSAGSQDVFLAGYDSQGNHLWSRSFGGPGTDGGSAVCVDVLGNVAMTGSFFETVDFGGGPLTSAGYDDLFVAAYDSMGDHAWSYTFGDIYNDGGRALVFTAARNVLFGGAVIGSVDFGGGAPLTTGGFLAEFEGVPAVSGVGDAPRYTNALYDNFPNPFNPTTTIKYSIEERAHVSLKIYNVAGQLVRSLVDEVQSPGTIWLATWDGRDNAGHSVSSGVYFYELVTKNFSQTKKAVFLK